MILLALETGIVVEILPRIELNLTVTGGERRAA
jgi:hypothetical protein